MKHGSLLISISISILLILSSCQYDGSFYSSPIAIATTIEPVQMTNTPSSTIDKKAEIIEQIKQSASAYNQFIENEKNTGNFRTVSLQNDAEGFEFIGDSYIKVLKQEELIQKKIQELNDEYYKLYEQEKQFTLTATPSSREEQQAHLDQLLMEYQAWLSNEWSRGTTIEIYSTSKMKYSSLFIGESYTVSQEKWGEITALRLSANMPPADLIQLDMQQIQSVESGNVSLIDIGTFPYYRTDIKLTTYETSTRLYNVYSQTHQIIEVLPKQLPDAAASSSVSDLEKLAREMIAKFSPDVNLENLTPAGGAKEGTYFFRWEDRTRLFLDDGRSYPFVQVGLNGKGELLNYYNTLPLAK